MKRAICTFGTGKHAEYLDVAMPSFMRFAARHGYDVIVADKIGTARPPSWYKVRMLQEALKDYDAALWIDADVVIVDSREDWQHDPKYWQSMVKHQTGDGEVPNHGIWYVTQAMIPMLDAIWGLDRYRFHGWWEQAASMSLMGYDPDNRPCRNTAPTPYYEATQFIDPGWNVHKWDKNKSKHNRFMHATMYADVLGTMQDWAEMAI